MENNIKIEELNHLNEKDYKSLVQLVVDTWQYEEWNKKTDVVPLAEIFLDIVLLTSSQIFVARDGEHIAGIVSATTDANIQETSKVRTRLLKSISHFVNDSKRNNFKFYLETLELNEFILQKSEKEFDASLNFLALNEEYRGLGLGKKLYNTFLNYLKQEGLNHFYLWTDDSSSYIFYERQGLKRIGSEKYNWNKSILPGNDFEEYYIYEGFVE